MNDLMVDMGAGPYVHETPSARFPVYTRGNAGEVWPDVVYPLTVSLSREFADPLIAAMLETGLVNQQDLAEGAGCAGGVFGGYMYLNLSLSRVIASRSPGVSIADSDAIYLGRDGSAPTHRVRKGDRNLRASFEAVRYMLGVLRSPDTSHLDADQTRVAKRKQQVPEELKLNDAELLQAIRGVLAEVMDLFATHITVSGKAAASVQFLASLCERHLGDREIALALLSSLGDVDSAAPSWALWEFGRTVRADAALTELFDDGVPGLFERLHAASEAARFNDELALFLDRFGARGPNEWEAASETWGTQPELALALIDRLRFASEDKSPKTRSVALTEARKRLATTERARVPRWARWQFDRALDAAAIYSVGRERSKTTVVELIHVNRVLTRELASRVSARVPGGYWEDMWFCLADELDAYVADPAPFSERIASRRATREVLAERIPPFVFEGQIPPVDTWQTRAEAAADVDVLAPGGHIEGIAAVPGVAEGRACVVTDPLDPGDLGPGDVLIAPLTDPAWTPLFVGAEAVVVDVGGQMSHAVIVAREFGMPCVVSATNATNRIPHGARVRVDGAAGTVTRIG